MRAHALVVGLSLLVSGSLDGQARPQPGDDLIGLWGSESIFGPQVRGELTLLRTGDRWTMQIAGFEVSARGRADSVRLALPGGQGELRARVTDGGVTVRGFWIQPAGNLPSYATPVALARVRMDAWRGRVTPLDDRFSIYLRVDRSADGGLRGSFRNPEMNWNGRSPWFHVTRERDGIGLTDPVSGRQRFVQPYDSAQRQIGMDFGIPIVLQPRGEHEAVGYFPRSPGEPAYAYRVPLPAADGWSTARARDVGMDEAALAALVQRLATVNPASDSAALIHSILIARRGQLVLEEYFFGYTADRVHDLRSASKTLTSVMAGVALERSGRFTMETPVYSLLGVPIGASDARKSRITVGHLLTHSSGLACNDNDEKSPGNEDTMQQQQKERDWYRYFLDLPVAADPGTTYAYCSGGINLVGAVVSKVTGSWLPDFFDRYIAQPLEIERYHVNLMPSGEAYAGGGTHMRPRDFLKLGQLYLNFGVWNERRIVSRTWVEESTAHRITVPDGSSDGYGWHRHTLRVGDRSYQQYEASGNGGQFLMVVPELQLTIVITGGNYNQYQIWKTFREHIVSRYVLTAVIS